MPPLETALFNVLSWELWINSILARAIELAAASGLALAFICAGIITVRLWRDVP